jgi:hypothetical protein
MAPAGFGVENRFRRFGNQPAFAAPRWTAPQCEVEQISFYDPTAADRFGELIREASARLHVLDPQFDLAELHLYMVAFHGFVDDLNGHLVGHGQFRSRCGEGDVVRSKLGFFVTVVLCGACCVAPPAAAPQWVLQDLGEPIVNKTEQTTTELLTERGPAHPRQVQSV